MAKKKTRRLVAFLLKEGVSTPQDAISDEINNLHIYPLARDVGVEGTVVVGPTFKTQPKWLEFLENAVGHTLEDIYNSSTRAVLLVKVDQRYIAFTFGYGRYLLRPDCYERDFGLRVALNSVDYRRLRSVDIANIEESTLQTRKQLSRVAALENFGLDIARDLLRAVTGEPDDKTFAKLVSGRDALVFSAEIEIEDIPAKAEKALDLYKSDRYKEHFEWVDHLSEVKDPDLLNVLNGQLITSLRNRDTRKMHLAPPEPIEWNEIDGFAYTTEGRSYNLKDDVDIDDYINTVSNTSSLKLETIKKHHRIKVQYLSQDSPIPRWTIYDSLVFENEHSDALYVLTLGRWYSVEKTFAGRVRRYIDDIPEFSLELPSFNTGEDEESYNQRVSQELGLVLFDRTLVRCEDTTSSIEVCDLFATEDKQFIHVKRRKSSAVHSHFFAQGRVAAESFLRDRAFRIEARVKAKDKGFDVSSFFPDETPLAANYGIVFAFIDTCEGKFSERLPFFSQLNLMQTARSIQLLGYKVQKACIRAR